MQGSGSAGWGRGRAFFRLCWVGCAARRWRRRCRSSRRRAVRPRLPPGRILGPLGQDRRRRQRLHLQHRADRILREFGPGGGGADHADTRYVRVYTEGTTRPVGGFIAGSDTVRGMTAAEIKDRLALPYLPDSLTIVRVPARTTILTGSGAPILGNFPANPPSIPVGGPWGSGGAAQSLLIGRTDDPNCANPQFLPSDAYANRQLIGDKALAYAPRAGGGNAGAIAEALDRATPPQLFGDMDHVYNSLDLLNYGDDDPLRSALQQLSGEVYADLPSVEIAGAQAFLNRAAAADAPVPNGGGPTAGGFAAAGPASPARRVPGSPAWAASAGCRATTTRMIVDFDILGVAIGFDHRLDDALAVGGALALSTSSFDTRKLSGDGDLTTVSSASMPAIRPPPGMSTARWATPMAGVR